MLLRSNHLLGVPFADPSGAPSYALWESKERSDFLLLARILFIAVAAAYVAHYLFFDRVMKLEPLEFWFRFRMTIPQLHY